MKKLFVLSALVLFTIGLHAQNKPTELFKKLKALKGEWIAKVDDTTNVVVLYDVVSNGSTVMETIKEGEGAGMITMYHLNKNKVMMTHYCSAGNQPRMQAVPGNNNNLLDFKFLDITDLDESEGHMNHLKMEFKNSDHFTQEWTFKGKKHSGSTLFSYERKK